MGTTVCCSAVVRTIRRSSSSAPVNYGRGPSWTFPVQQPVLNNSEAMDQVKNPAKNLVKKKQGTREAMDQVKNPAKNLLKKKQGTREAMDQVKNPAKKTSSIIN